MNWCQGCIKCLEFDLLECCCRGLPGSLGGREPHFCDTQYTPIQTLSIHTPSSMLNHTIHLKSGRASKAYLDCHSVGLKCSRWCLPSCLRWIRVSCVRQSKWGKGSDGHRWTLGLEPSSIISRENPGVSCSVTWIDSERVDMSRWVDESIDVEFLDRLILTNIVSYFYSLFFKKVLCWSWASFELASQALMSWPTQWRLRPVAKACAGATCCPFSKSRSVELQMRRGRMTLNWNSWHMSRNMLIYSWIMFDFGTDLRLLYNYINSYAVWRCFEDVLKVLWRLRDPLGCLAGERGRDWN